MNFRKLHKKTALILFLPLLLSAFTGIAYRIGRTWFGLSNEFGDVMMTIHEGRFLGKPLAPFYVLLTGLGLVGMLVTGITLIRRRKSSQGTPAKLNHRLIHGFMAPITFLPLLVSASTGVIYRLGKAWFGLSDGQAQFFMNIHQGSYLGKELRAFYVLFVGLGLLTMLATGVQMTGIFRNRPSKSVSGS